LGYGGKEAKYVYTWDSTSVSTQPSQITQPTQKTNVASPNPKQVKKLMS